MLIFVENFVCPEDWNTLEMRLLLCPIAVAVDHDAPYDIIGTAAKGDEIVNDGSEMVHVEVYAMGLADPSSSVDQNRASPIAPRFRFGMDSHETLVRLGSVGEACFAVGDMDRGTVVSVQHTFAYGRRAHIITRSQKLAEHLLSWNLLFGDAVLVELHLGM